MGRCPTAAVQICVCKQSEHSFSKPRSPTDAAKLAAQLAVQLAAQVAAQHVLLASALPLNSPGVSAEDKTILALLLLAQLGKRPVIPQILELRQRRAVFRDHRPKLAELLDDLGTPAGPWN